MAVIDLLRGAVGKIEVQTSWGPPIVMEDPFGPSSGAGTFATKLLKPKMIIYGSGGGILYQKAPYGEPGVSKWPLVLFATVLGATLIAGYAAKGLKR